MVGTTAAQMAALKAGCLVAKMVDHLVVLTAAHSAANLVVHSVVRMVAAKVVSLVARMVALKAALWVEYWAVKMVDHSVEWTAARSAANLVVH